MQTPFTKDSSGDDSCGRKKIEAARSERSLANPWGLIAKPFQLFQRRLAASLRVEPAAEAANVWSARARTMSENNAKDASNALRFIFLIEPEAAVDSSRHQSFGLLAAIFLSDKSLRASGSRPIPEGPS